MLNEWQSMNSLPLLEHGELQIWRIDLSDVAGELTIYSRHLSHVELERADRLREGQVRMQFVVARACLRILLGNLLHSVPNLVPISLTQYGKPEVPSGNGFSLFFNVAHARETILIALCRSSSVGVDVEYFDRETEILEIAYSSFTQGEILQIEQAGNPAERQRAFFTCWTRKEAVVKADGRGLSLPLNSVEVPVSAPAESTMVLIPDRAHAARPRTWYVTDLQFGDKIAGAFAAAVPDLEPRTFTFPLELLSRSPNA